MPRPKSPPRPMSSKCAYVTLLTKPSYLAGVLVLDHCLRAVHSRYPLVVMITSSLPEEARLVLRKRSIRTREVKALDPPLHHTLASHDSRFADTWTKLRGFELVEYKRIVLLDCDMIVLKNMDELMAMDLPHDHIAAAHVCACNPRGIEHYPIDWRPDNCAHTTLSHPTSLPPLPTHTSPRPHTQLNSGTVVLNPSKPLAASIVHHLYTSPRVAEWKFPDQDMLSEYFKGKWRPISWYYNALRSLYNSHPTMWSEREIRCLHYIFADKPWQSRRTPRGMEKGFDVMDKWWWERFDALGESIARADPTGWKFLLSTVDNSL
ncbi:nucleotide-diphospho-sugar transferase [Crepidotus variabilis]|uniref:Nucleotide-diphospho-sugar transferase n=1 Tax=Crepidotus variabilis TaxID=179855 RepID=A0A9P6ENI9_9AGAR|nr:nucleotide-diphospho-sugar transferase [Crepidotus variabilis]